MQKHFQVKKSNFQSLFSFLFNNNIIIRFSLHGKASPTYDINKISFVDDNRNFRTKKKKKRRRLSFLSKQDSKEKLTSRPYTKMSSTVDLNPFTGPIIDLKTEIKDNNEDKVRFIDQNSMNEENEEKKEKKKNVRKKRALTKSKSQDFDKFNEIKQKNKPNDETKQAVNELFVKKRQTVIDSYESEIKALQLSIDRLKNEMNEKLNELDQMESETLQRVDKDDSYFEGDFSSKYLKKENLILSDLRSKLKLAFSIEEENAIFALLDDLVKKNPDEPVGTIIAEGHFGYQLNPYMIEYSKVMKVIYCAVHSKTRNMDHNMFKHMKFTASAAYHFVAQKHRTSTYSDLRRDSNVNFVREVWEILEDPLTKKFATSLGFAPSVEKMKTNSSIYIPVLKKSVFDYFDEDYQNYFIGCKFISPFYHDIHDSLTPKVKIRENYDESEAKDIIRRRSSFSRVVPFLSAERTKTDEEGKNKKKKKKPLHFCFTFFATTICNCFFIF